MQQANATRLRDLVQAAARARAAGDFPTALSVASQAAREGLGHPVLLRIQAEALATAGRFADAGDVLNRALSLAPRDPLTIADIGRVLVAENRVGDAIAAFTAAVSVRPDFADAWLELGSAHELAGDAVAARAAYEKASALAPQNARAWAALAAIAVRRGNNEEARALAKRAMGLEPDESLASLALAHADVNDGAVEAARERLEGLLAGGALDERQTQVALGLLGDALDRLERPADAFAAYSRMNDLMLEKNASRFGEQGTVESHLEFVRRLTRWFERQDPALWRQPVAVGDTVSPVRRHVFLLGYPRSGTTLVENILASLPDVRALEERPTLADADLALLRDDPSLDKLTHLDPALADQLRSAYWKRVRADVPDVDGKVFVDMAPLNGLKLPMIARLFPNAVVVLCRRDPRDVVLSCFRRNFRVNASTYQMGRLDSAARHFDAVMRLTELHVGMLPLPVHVVNYADLVADFEGTTRALAEFVGLPWTKEVHDFSRTAAGRELRTVSAPQVRRGLFDGTNQWLKYREQLAPVLPVLEPWVEKFGCTPS
jgi:tetratricopeptide (TPR) repeat protein